MISPNPRNPATKKPIRPIVESPKNFGPLGDAKISAEPMTRDPTRMEMERRFPVRSISAMRSSR